MSHFIAACRRGRFRPTFFLLLGGLIGGLLSGAGAEQRLRATDYFLTIAGGYSPSGNQASLEANVLFFQQVLSERHAGPHRHSIFFADGDDPGADLQVLAERPAASDAPATSLLAALHRRGGGQRIAYRNHEVPDIAGPLDPALIRANLETLAATAGADDRLIVFVTAHGSDGKDEKGVAGRYNTSIDCWNERKIAAREFAGWLDKLPSEMPVVMVMAQCYCGGFAHTIFSELDPSQGLSPHLRVGFFAQQHNLPAAGCRPDIEHDEEFSSYFWGAIAGRSRNGIPKDGCDIDGDGVVSFAEAYAHAVIAGETIDIPLCTSEVLLKTYSQLAPTNEANGAADFATLSGKLADVLAGARPVSARIVTELAKSLGLSLEDDVSVVFQRYEDERQARRSQGRGRSRQRSGRRELLSEVAAKWPELGEGQTWRQSPLLAADNQEQLLAELQQLPSWNTYDERRKEREKADRESQERELRTVKFRRLTSALEAIVLEKNLARVAAPAVVEKYRRIVALEESSLAPPGNPIPRTSAGTSD
jgi:hypothetical protein